MSKPYRVFNIMAMWGAMLGVVLGACSAFERPIPGAPAAATAPTADPDTPEEIAYHPPTWTGTLPILTAANQGLVYGPGQLVMALAEGLDPTMEYTISLVHGRDGVLGSASTVADSQGGLVLAHAVRMTGDEEGARPAGQLVFSVPEVREYAFAIDYDKAATPAPAECGVYPEQAHIGGTIVFWCGGFEPGANPKYKLHVNGQEYGSMELTAPVGSDGLLIDFFATLPGEPVGTWTVEIDGCQVSFQVVSP